MKSPLIERETIIVYNEAEPTASVYTMNPALKRKLAAMALECPESVRHSKDFEDGGVEYIVPKKNVVVKKPRKIPDNLRGILAENARKNFGYQKKEV